MLKILGRYDEGINAYRRSIELVENNGAGWWGLADMKTFRLRHDDFGAMEQIAGNKSDAKGRATVAGCLCTRQGAGRCRENMQNHFPGTRRPMRSGRASILMRKSTKPGIDELIRTFTIDFLAKGAQSGPDGPTPIFITGLPRSGSTLVEQILASHSLIEGTMELIRPAKRRSPDYDRRWQAETTLSVFASGIQRG